MAGKKYERNIDGLIDACFDQLQDLNDGISDKEETVAFARTADVIVRAIEVTTKREALHFSHKQRMAELTIKRLEIIHDAKTINQEDLSESEIADDFDEGSEEGGVGSDSGALGIEEAGGGEATRLRLESCLDNVEQV